MTTTDEDAHARRTAMPQASWHQVVSALAPTGLFAGLLYYFGHVSARAFYAYFGVPLDVLDLSTADILFRSADSVFRPLSVMLVAALGLFIALQAVPLVLDRTSRRAALRVVLAFAVIALLLGAVGVMGLYVVTPGILAPAALAVAAALFEAAGLAATRIDENAWAASVLGGRRPSARRGLLLLLFAVACFWAVAILATQRGTQVAHVVEATLIVQPQAVVYTDEDIQLSGPGVRRIELTDDSRYHYRYLGLRPLRHANGRWFLLPSGWTRSSLSPVILIEDDPGHVRVDLAPGAP